MARRSSIAAAAALIGFGKGLEEIGKRKREREDTAEALFLRLLLDNKLKLKDEFANVTNVPVGTTYIQVRNMFKIDEDQEALSDLNADERLLIENAAAGKADIFEGVAANAKIGARTIKLATTLMGQTSREEIATDKFTLAKEKFEQSKKDTLVDITQAFLKMSNDDQRLFRRDFKSIFDFISGKTDDLDIASVPTELATKHPTIAAVLGIFGRDVERPGITPGGPEVPPPRQPGFLERAGEAVGKPIVAGVNAIREQIGGEQAQDVDDTQAKIQGIAQIGTLTGALENYDSLGFNHPKEVKPFMREHKQEIDIARQQVEAAQGQLAPPSAVDSGVGQHIGQQLKQQPQALAGTAAGLQPKQAGSRQRAFAPNSRVTPVNQLKSLMLMRGSRPKQLASVSPNRSLNLRSDIS